MEEGSKKLPDGFRASCFSFCRFFCPTPAQAFIFRFCFKGFLQAKNEHKYN